MSRLEKLGAALALALFLSGAVLITKPASSSAATPSPAAGHSKRATAVVEACPSPYTQGFHRAPANVPAGCPAPCPALQVSTPPTMGGLVVSREDPCGDFQASNPARALDAVSLYSLREPTKLLIATLEIGRFTKKAPLDDSSFRGGVIAQVGSTEPQPLWLDGREVYATASTGLVLISWYRGRYLFILAVRDNYAEPKAILRDALKVAP